MEAKPSAKRTFFVDGIVIGIIGTTFALCRFCPGLVARARLALQNRKIAVGAALPDSQVWTSLSETASLRDTFAGKKGILFGVPGAFTPTCSKTHLPGFVREFDALKGKGIDVVACLSVNSKEVMQAWGNQHGADGKVLMLADTDAEATLAMGLGAHKPKLGGVRTTRFSAIIEDGRVVKLNVEAPGEMKCSSAEASLDFLAGNQN